MKIKTTVKNMKPTVLTKDRIYPVIPLKNLVVFPSMVIPFIVGRKFSINAIEEAMKGDKRIFLVMQRRANITEPKTTDLHKVGTICEILQILKIPDGTIKVLVEGIKRAQIKNIYMTDDYFQSELDIPVVEDDESEKGMELEALKRNTIQLFEHYVKLNKKIPPETIVTAMNTDSVDEIVDIIAAQLNSKPSIKQKLLSIFNHDKRLKELNKVLQQEIEILNVEKEVQEKVRNNMQKTQREYYLQEQMKVIKKELGDKGEYLDDADELKKAIEKANLPKEAAEKCKKEISRLEKMPPMSAEASVIRTYVDWILDLPWKKKTTDKNDIKKAAKILDEDHYGLKKVKERILEYMAVRQIADKIKGQILCFVGPPGVGKTSLARSIARSLGRNFIRISLGGVRDEAEIRGHRRTYVGALPGRIIQGMKKAKSKNPLFLMDEIDKMSTDFRGDPSSALLEVLDPEQNNTFSDHYIELPFDLSDVLFITTANSTYNIPRPLLDRMETIEISGYTESEKMNIAEKFLIPRQVKEHGLTEDNIKFTPNGIREIIQHYTREAGVRELERTIASICRKVAKKIVESGNKSLSIKITQSMIHDYLGAIKFRYGVAEEKNEIGVATGLAWTEAGGDILAIEVSVVPGTGKLILTGKLGEIMQESAQAALSYARSKAKEFHLPENFYKKNDIHIHVPEGAVPKDGPSAGITIATALISALSKIPIRKDVAMTGEITLRGKVLPIGGLKEKVLSALRANITNIIVPAENKKDFEDIPKQVHNKIKFYLVKKMEQVLKVALTKNDFIDSDTGEIFSLETNKKSPDNKKRITKSKKRSSIKKDWESNAIQTGT